MRCPNGTRKNKQGVCVPKVESKEITPKKSQLTQKRCPNGTRKNKQGECVPKDTVPAKSITKEKPVPKVKPTSEFEKVASRIQRFMNRTKTKRREMYLKSICSEAGLCIAFGIETLKIKDFFRNFSFDLVDQVKRIGAPSANGFVNELRYTKRGYNAYAVLKSTTSYDSDNLMYEYRVGQFLNKMSFLFPCFLETYGLFKYKTEQNWSHMERTQQVLPDVFRTMLEPQPFDLKVGCPQSRHMAVLIQHIRGCKLANEILTKDTFQHILPMLFQIYYPLFHMRKNFTHYDLHTSNVVLYEPVPGKYIQFHYKTQTGVISFKSPYIAKMIDYGHSYFKEDEDSKDIYDKVCQLEECKPKCGNNFGFSAFPLSNERNFYHVVTQKKNESHDLRFLNMVLNEVKTMSTPLWFKAYMESFKIEYKHHYGTAEKSCPRKQCDIEGVYKKLEKIIPLSNLQLDPYHTDKYGDLYVYGDKPIQFRKS
jgi:hypothetical protein